MTEQNEQDSTDYLMDETAVTISTLDLSEKDIEGLAELYFKLHARPSTSPHWSRYYFRAGKAFAFELERRRTAIAHLDFDLNSGPEEMGGLVSEDDTVYTGWTVEAFPDSEDEDQGDEEPPRD